MGLVLGGGGCRQENASHCGNQQGDATCGQRGTTALFCNICVTENDGCVAEQPIAGCEFDEGSTGLATTVSEESTESTAEASTDAADSSTGEPNLCGNGMIDEGEVCDGDMLPVDAADCDTMGYGSGPPGCEDDCSRLNYMMCPGYVEECGNQEVGSGEECDGTVFGGGKQSCDDFMNLMGDGLVCTSDCMFDTTDCMFCREHDEGCVDGDMCCEAGEMCISFLNLGDKCCVPNGLGGCQS